MIKALSATTSFFTGILIVALYLTFHSVPLGFEILFKILPDGGDIYIGDRLMEGIVVYFIFAFTGLGLFFFARRRPGKKISNLVLYVASVLFIIVLQISKILYGAKLWNYEWHYYWDEGLKNFMLDMLPFTFLLLGFLVVFGSRKATMLLTVLFFSIGLYHLLLAVGFLRVFGRAFSAVSRGDLIVVITITVCSIAFALVNLIAFKRMKVQGNKVGNESTLTVDYSVSD